MAIIKLSTNNKKIFFNHSSVDGHVVCFHILRIVNNASMNIEVHVPFQTRVFVCLFQIYTQAWDCWIIWHFQGFPGGSVVKNSPPKAGDAGDAVSVTGSGRFSGGRNDNPLQYSCLKNPMDRGDWQVTVHVIPKSWTQLSTHTHGNHISVFFFSFFRKFHPVFHNG